MSRIITNLDLTRQKKEEDEELRFETTELHLWSLWPGDMNVIHAGFVNPENMKKYLSVMIRAMRQLHHLKRN